MSGVNIGHPSDDSSASLESIEIAKDATVLDRMYKMRFSRDDSARKDLIWQEIARHLQRYVDLRAVVLDIGCDHGDFIRNIKAGEKWATDLRDVSGLLPDGIQFVQSDGLILDRVLPQNHFDVVFMSNYLEHLRCSTDVIRQLEVICSLLKPGGTAIVLQPNIRLVGAAYWDFIDHSVALTEHSLVEAAELAGLRCEKVIVRFLPYTTKRRLLQHPYLVRAYLACPAAWVFMGRQTLLIARRPVAMAGVGA